MDNLRSVDYTPLPTLPTVANHAFNTSMALLNIRSLVGKSFLINDFIIKHNLDFIFLTETWLSVNNSDTVLIESAPPGFIFINEARIHRKGGGVAILYKETLQCKKMSCGIFNSFEYVAAQLSSPQRTILLTIYRPPKYDA